MPPIALLCAACGGSGQGSFGLELAGQIGGRVRHMQLDGDRAI
jgi:hypothetical protein